MELPFQGHVPVAQRRIFNAGGRNGHTNHESIGRIGGQRWAVGLTEPSHFTSSWFVILHSDHKRSKLWLPFKKRPESDGIERPAYSHGTRVGESRIALPPADA